ncbi:unnamed protein product [Adineta steineri]|uniref:Uncharacterized protein n=1 Tax=Adineta steineri TaxID=433720 RepID=A0A816AJF4_9BILA|nr:unnamed protein product [Adineta steineri]CAF1598315.1 unnamed protein product [Adineta steineri]
MCSHITLSLITPSCLLSATECINDNDSKEGNDSGGGGGGGVVAFNNDWRDDNVDDEWIDDKGCGELDHWKRVKLGYVVRLATSIT